MCGSSGDLKKTKVEGTTLKLCENCQEVGDVVEESTPSRKKRTSSTPSPGVQEEVVPDFDERVKRAREENDMTVSDLADRLKEKNSVVKRVESGSLTPDRDLARKFESELGIVLYEKPPEEPSASTTEDSGETTIGDVADVRKS